VAYVIGSMILVRNESLRVKSVIRINQFPIVTAGNNLS
jgi:hypothetical protein